MKYLFVKIFSLVSFLFLVSSCGLTGGDKAEPVEESVLSGPPLAIPPEFSIESPDQVVIDESSNTALEESAPLIESIESENNQNFEIETLDSNEFSSINENQGFETENTINSIETYSENDFQTYEEQGNKSYQRTPRRSRVMVPSDAYNFISNSNRQNTVVKQSNLNSSRSFRKKNNSSLNTSGDLSKDELDLLQDVFDATEDLEEQKSKDQEYDGDFDQKGGSE